MPTSLSSKQAFLIGSLGGVAPILVRGAVYVFSHSGVTPPLSSGQLIAYFGGLVVFLVFGGIVAVALDDGRTLKSAFLVGVSLPSLFQVSGLQADAPKTADISAPFSVAFIASASAQERLDRDAAKPESTLPKDNPGSRRKLEISIPNNQSSKNVSATFLDESGNRISSKVVELGFGAVDVPPKAASVQFEKDGSASESHPLSQTDVQTAKVAVEQTSVSAFIQAIGLSRKAKPSIELLKVEDAKKLPVSTYGWCNLGERGPDGWRVRNVDFSGPDVQTGSIVTVNSPLTVRPTAESSDVIGVAHVGQHLRVDEIKNEGNLCWAAITVLE